MEDLKDFGAAMAQIAEEKGISSEKVLETVEQAIAAAYKKDYGKKGQIIKAEIDKKSGDVKFWQVKIVVDKDEVYSPDEISSLEEKMETKKKLSLEKEKKAEKAKEEEQKIRFNPEKHILLKEAKKIDKSKKTGDEIIIPLQTTEEGYGRIAAQTAKQVILQKLREAERESILEEYQEKEGEVISGIVQRIEGRNVFLDVGKTLGFLPREEQVPGEFYRPGQRLKVFVLKVEQTPKGPRIILSRAYPKIISKLFELEVPEISAGQVEIKSIAREPGSRTKIAVSSNEEEIDPIGSTVGQRGTRVQAVINELGGEKIDIIEWLEEPEKFIANSLSPAKVLEVKILPKNKALCIVPEDQLSLAIGKDGQNVRLAAKLTGWKIDVRSSEKEEDKEKEKEVEEKKEKEIKKEKPKKPSSAKTSEAKKEKTK